MYVTLYWGDAGMDNSNLLRDLVRALEKNIGAFEKSKMKCCGLNIGQCYVVLEIGLADEISLIDLAKLLNLDKSTMSRAVNNLVNAGLVDRLIDAGNRRYVKLQLTEQGQSAFTIINATFDSYLMSILDAIPEDKRDQVMESLKILIVALNKNQCC